MKFFKQNKFPLFVLAAISAALLLTANISFAEDPPTSPAAPVAPTATPAPTAPPAPTQPQPAAQSPQPGNPAYASQAGNSFTENAGSFSSIALYIIGAALWVIRSLIFYILIGAGRLLDYMLFANTNLNPANMPAIQLGWAVTRDLANSLFILIILWVAFTIIFNREQWGGKALLIRVITVALLINFSLVFVMAVFGFTNLLADEFSQKLPRNGNQVLTVSDFLVDKLRVMTLLQQPSQNQVRQFTEEEKKAIATNRFGPTTDINGNPIQGTFNTQFKNTLLASLGVQTAQGDIAGGIGGALTGCALGLFWGPLGCAVVGTAGALAGALFVNSSLSAYQFAVREGVTAIFFLLTATAFLLAGLFLLFRLIAMIILSILAPVAIFAHAIPGNHGKKYWDMWLNALLRWAFFAPIFYFLLYISLFMLNEFSKQKGEALLGINISADTDYFIVMLATVSLIVAAIMITRKTAGAIADTAIGYGKTVAGFAAGGVVGAGALGAGFAARRAAPAIERGLGRVANVPIIGKATAPFARRVQGYLEKEKGKIDDHKKQVGNWSAEGKVAEFRRSASPERQLGAAEALMESGDFDKLEKPEQEKVTKLAQKFGRERNVMKAVPHQITTEIAQKIAGPEVWKKTVEEARTAGGNDRFAAHMVAAKKINLGDIPKVVDDAYTPEFMDAALQVWSPQHIEALVRHKPVLAAKMADRLFKIPERDKGKSPSEQKSTFDRLSSAQKEAYARYFTGAPNGRTLIPNFGDLARAGEGREETRRESLISTDTTNKAFGEAKAAEEKRRRGGGI